MVAAMDRYRVVALYNTAPLRGSDKNHKFTNGSGDGTIAAIYRTFKQNVDLFKLTRFGCRKYDCLVFSSDHML